MGDFLKMMGLLTSLNQGPTATAIVHLRLPVEKLISFFRMIQV